MKKPTGGSALIPSPRRGRIKVGVIGLLGSGAPLSRPFPIKGKGVQMRCNDMPPFSSSVGERKIMNHFVVSKSWSHEVEDFEDSKICAHRAK